MESKALDDYLNTRQAEGRFFDTQSFTINELKAREKLAQYQLADSGLWLVKLVQAAVASKTDGIRITFGKRLVEVEFANPLKLKADDLLNQVLSGEISTDSVLFHLVTGLRASAAKITESVSWQCGGALVTLDAQGSSIQESADDGKIHIEAVRASRQRGLKKSLHSPIRHLLKQTADEYAAVASRCWPSPIPIWLDGKELQRGYKEAGRASSRFNPEFKVTAKRKGQLSLCVGVMPLEVESVSKLPYPLRPLQVSEPVDYELSKTVPMHGTFLRWHNQSDKVAGVLTVSCGSRSENFLDLILDGVLVESRRLPRFHEKEQSFFVGAIPVANPNHMRLALPVSLGDLDLSQFACGEIEFPHGLTEAWKQGAQEIAEVGQKHARELLYHPFVGKTGKAVSVGFGVQAIGLGIASKGLLLLPLLGMTGLVAVGNTLIWRNMLKTDMKKLLDELKSGTYDFPTSLPGEEERVEL